MITEEKGQLVNKFYTLPLEMNKINSLSLSWTLVHEINEESPLHQLDAAFFLENQGEILVFIKTFDDMFSTIVGAHTSYTFDEIVYDAKFEMMYHENKNRTKTILELDKLNSYVKT
jgi:inward rectifier potassium channel